MAISRFDSPAQAEFMQTYVPVPFEELMQAGAVQQQRWEDSDATAQEVQSIFGNIPSLSNVTLSSGEVLEVGNAKHVQAKVDEFQTRLDEISSNFSNKASVEHRSALKALITDLRKEQGSSGLFGRSAADVENYQAFIKSREDAKLGSKLHRATYSDEYLKQFAAGAQEGYNPFTGGGPILGDVDIHEELNKTLKNVGEVVLSNPSVANMPLDQILRYYSSGVGYDRLVGITENLIVQNEDIKQDIIAQEYAKGYRDEDLEEAVNKRISQYADTMAKVYTKQKLNTSWTNDALAIHAGKNKIDNQEMVFANRVNLPLPAVKGFQNNEELDATIEARKNTAAELAVTAMEALTAEWNMPEGTITVDPTTGELIANEPAEGLSYIDTGAPAEFTDVARLVHGYNMQIRQANKAASDALRLKNNMMRKHGITEEYLNSPEHLKAVEEAKKKASQEFDKYANTGTIGVGGAPTNIKSANDPKYREVQESILDPRNVDKARQEYANAYYTEHISDFDPRYSAMNKELKEMSTSNSFEAAVVNLPKDFKNYLELSIANLPYDAALNWKDARKGTGPLTEDERTALIDKAETKPVALGPYYDQATGKMEVLYSVKDKNGKTFTVSSSMPLGMEKELYKAGLFDQFTSAVYTGLYEQIGAANNISGTGVLNMPGGVSVNYYGKNSTGQYVVDIPLEGGGVEAIPFNTEGEMINTLTQISRAAVAKELNLENK